MTEIYSYELQYRDRQKQFLDEAEQARLVSVARRSRRNRIKRERRARHEAALTPVTQPAPELTAEHVDAIPRQRTEERESANVA